MSMNRLLSRREGSKFRFYLSRPAEEDNGLYQKLLDLIPKYQGLVLSREKMKEDDDCIPIFVTSHSVRSSEFFRQEEAFIEKYSKNIYHCSFIFDYLNGFIPLPSLDSGLYNTPDIALGSSGKFDCDKIMRQEIGWKKSIDPHYESDLEEEEASSSKPKFQLVNLPKKVKKKKAISRKQTFTLKQKAKKSQKSILQIFPIESTKKGKKSKSGQSGKPRMFQQRIDKLLVKQEKDEEEGGSEEYESDSSLEESDKNQESNEGIDNPKEKADNIEEIKHHEADDRQEKNEGIEKNKEEAGKIEAYKHQEVDNRQEKNEGIEKDKEEAGKTEEDNSQKVGNILGYRIQPGYEEELNVIAMPLGAGEPSKRSKILYNLWQTSMQNPNASKGEIYRQLIAVLETNEVAKFEKPNTVRMYISRCLTEGNIEEAVSSIDVDETAEEFRRFLREF